MNLMDSVIFIIAIGLLIATVGLFTWITSFKIPTKFKVKLGTVILCGWLLPALILFAFPLFFKPYTESNYGMVRSPNLLYPLTLLLVGIVSAIGVPVITYRVASDTKLKPFVTISLICAIASSLAFAYG